ncbi:MULTISPECIES: beta-ketoacyl-[acyl-carrier-protein] synthase family protein [Pseudomonas]|uniref:beta-ketoacyl-[acyl-carrier-protein] synthase family protein n=1 Tax=Pseudomonas TaxID=286 RepID=UPI0020A02C37
MQTKKRVVVTGFGSVCALGRNTEEIWGAIKDYQMGYALHPMQDQSVTARFFGKIDFPIELKAVPKRIAKNLPRFARIGMSASEQALCMAFGDDPVAEMDKHYSPFDRGVVLGTGWGGVDSTIDNNDMYVESGLASPLSTIFSMHSVWTGSASMAWNLRGYQNTLVAACATGNIAIGDACEVIRSGRAKCMLAGGSESITGAYNVWSVDILGALSKEQENPAKACCPFSQDRSGFVLSEGSAVLVLEDLDEALKRGATIYAEISGYANYSDAYDITAPAEDLLGRAMSMEKAIEEAGLNTWDIDYINAHGTSTQLNDLNETNTIKKVFGEHAHTVPISSTKSYTGHLIAAAGAIETVFCIKTIQTGMAPATINLERSDPLCDLDYIPNEHRYLGVVDNVLNINYGFGGANSCLVIRRYS